MLILLNPEAVRGIADEWLRALVTQRFGEILQGEPYDPALYGHLIVVEPGDRIEDLEAAAACPILSNRYDRVRFNDPAFTPWWEWLGDHGPCYELVFVLDDSGYGALLFIPKVPGVDAELLKMCQQFATPAG